MKLNLPIYVFEILGIRNYILHQNLRIMYDNY